MSDETIKELIRRAPFSFVGTVEHLGAATMSDIPINEHTAVVRVDYVQHGPSSFNGFEGQRITLQLAADKDLPKVGDSAAFFAEGLAFGESIAVAEVGRLPVDDVEPLIKTAMSAGESRPFAALEHQVETELLREHADSADAVILGRVLKLEKVLKPHRSEHDPDWWRATINVFHVEKGNITPGKVRVLYANSLDIQWRNSPKPKASQGGLWLLHATEGELREAGEFMILHPEDFQPTQNLESLRGGG